MTELELHPAPEVAHTTAPDRQLGWQQNHVIIGGWPEAMTPDERANTAQAAFATSQGLAAQAFHPFVPGGSAILKIQFATETITRQGHFHLQKQLQTLALHREDFKLLWASLERPPQVAFRRRVLTNAADTLRAMVGPDAAKGVRADLPAGTVLLDRLPVAEISHDGFLDVKTL